MERDAHSQRWQTSELITDPITGVAVAQERSFVQLNTGGYFLNPKTGQWQESQPFFALTPDGQAVTPALHHKVTVSFDPEGIPLVQLSVPEGPRLTTRLLGLALYDPDTEQALLIGSIRPCEGELAGPTQNQVAFANCFEGVKADLVYEVGQAYLAQDVVLREKIVPERFGDFSSRCRLEVWSEFLDVEAPQITENLRPRATDPNSPSGPLANDWRDQTLSWGPLVIGPGKAFSANQSQPGGPWRQEGGLAIEKQWVSNEGRQFMIESLPLEQLAPLMKLLPSPSAALRPKDRMASPVKRTVLLAQLASQRDPRASPTRSAQIQSGPPKIAALSPLNRQSAIENRQSQSSAPGVVLDYVVVSGAYNYIFRADTTYWVNI